MTAARKHLSLSDGSEKKRIDRLSLLPITPNCSTNASLRFKIFLSVINDPSFTNSRETQQPFPSSLQQRTSTSEQKKRKATPRARAPTHLQQLSRQQRRADRPSGWRRPAHHPGTLLANGETLPPHEQERMPASTTRGGNFPSIDPATRAIPAGQRHHITV